MKKLHVKINDQWKPVLCEMGGVVIICEETPKKALPAHPRWADEDLRDFQEKYSNNEFCLLDINK